MGSGGSVAGQLRPDCGAIFGAGSWADLSCASPKRASPSAASELEKAGSSGRRGSSRIDEPSAYHAEGVVYLTPNARFDHLLALPEGGNIGQAINEAMADIEKHNPQLAGVLPRTFQVFTSTLLKELLKKVSEIPDTLDYDAFGRIYEYFLGEFARTEGQKGGEFFTPSCIVRLIVEILEPYHGRVLDPACGSGGMFVQSARFVQEHRKNPSAELASARPGAGRRDRRSLAHEPCRPRTRRRYPRGQLLLRRRARQHRQLRLRPRQSAVQRQRRR